MTSCTRRGKDSVDTRPLRHGDTSQLQAMVLALYREDPPGQKMSPRKLQRTIAELRAHPGKGTIAIMRVAEAIVGYAIVVYYWSNEYGGNIALIDELYVKPAWRRKGVGSSCLLHIAKRTRMNLKGMHLETTPSNRRARAFYSRHGFRVVANRHMFRELP